MTKLLKFTSSRKLGVSAALDLSRVRPKEIMALGRKSIVFRDFNDWLLAAQKAASITPYALFWREIALKYPVADVLANLDNLLKAAGERPELSDQVQAVLLKVPAKKLPSVKHLRQLPSSLPEQAHIRTTLVRKKILGNEVFLRKRFFQVVRAAEDGVIYFPLENGQTVSRYSNIFQEKRWQLKKNRCQTVYGPATIIPVIPKEEGTNPIFLLVDGDFLVRKFYPAEYQRISLTKS